MAKGSLGIIALAGALAACGGGGGGGGGAASGVSPGPAPATQTTTTGAATVPAAAVAATFANGALAPPAIDPGEQSTLTTSESQNTITLTLVTGGAAYTHTFSGQNVLTTPAFLSGFSALGDGTPVPTDVLVLDASLSYAVYGEWEHDNDTTASSGLIAGFATGAQTPAANMPISGTAAYSGRAIGGLSSGGTTYALAGTSSFAADFGARTVTGTMALNATPDGGTTVGFWNTVTFGAAIAAGTNQFAGTASAPAATGIVATPAMAGTATGNFYGPQANELAGEWALTGSGAVALGSFGGSQAAAAMTTGAAVTAAFGINAVAPLAAVPTGTVAGTWTNTLPTGNGARFNGTLAGNVVAAQPAEPAGVFTGTNTAALGLFGAHH